MDALATSASWAARLARALRAAERVLLPEVCVLCALPAHPHCGLCLACARSLPAASAPLPAALSAQGATGRAALDYTGTAAELLGRYKFGGDLAAGRALAALALPAFAEAPRPQALVPVPLHRARLRRRGHDQALGLARDWARALGLPVLTGALARRRDTAPQTTLDAEGRRRNLEGAFTACAGARLPGHVALVDDVLTTGSTAAAAVAALRAAGVTRVQVWTAAQAARAK